MQHSHATSMARNTTTTATTALTHSASTATSDTLFRLECVLLFALDVVRGPYIHSSAPANPPEAIRSFLQSQAAPDSSSPAAAAYSAVAASSLAAGASTVRCGAPPLQQQQPPCLRKVSPETIGGDIAAVFPAGSHTDTPTALPNTKWASSAILASRSFGASSIGTSDCVLATGSFSSLYVPTPPSPPPLTAAVDAPPPSEPSMLQHSARVPLLSQPPLPAKSLVNHADATSGLPISILGNMPSSSMHSVASSNMAPRCLVGLSDPPTSDVARAYVVGASGTERAASEDITVFGVSPQTCKSDSHRTLPSLSATMGLCAFGASRSAGGGDGLALCANSVEHVGESAHASDGHCRDTRSEAPRALGGKTGIGSGTPLTGKPAAARSAPLPPTSATVSGTAADSDRMSGYNDVFVPRSEFCRRVLWLYPAESGLLFLYYPEDIPGEHYQRKTLRYSLCLVFRVDHKRMTIGDGLLHQRVHPYSVVLTNIAEELREAELKYAYMSRGLRSFNSASRQLSSLALISPISSFPAPATAAPPPVTSSITTTPATEGSEDVEEDVGQAHVATALALPSGAAPKPYALPCSRTTGQSGTVATAVSAAAALGGTVRLQPPAEMADRTPALRMPPQQSATPSLGEGTEGRRSAEGVTPTASGGCNWQQCKGGAGDAQGCHNGEDGSLPPGVRGSAASSPRVIANTAASTMANAPSPGLGTPLSTPMGTHSCSSGGLTGAIAVDTASAGADGVAGDGGVRASSSYVISMEMINMATAPPSLLPVCSRTMGEAAAADHPSPAQLEALGGWVGTPVSHSAAFSSPSATTAPASAFSAALGGTRQQMLPLHSTVGANPITSPRLPFPHRGLAPTAAVAGADGSTTAVPNMHILNAFITPPTAPQWTPLNELVAEIFHCLSYTSEAPDGTGNCEQDGPIGSPAAGGRTPPTVSPTSAGATIGLAAQEPKGALGAEISNKAWTQRPNPTTSASPTGQQQQRGDTSVVHLSSRLSFHVRRMAPLQSARLLHLDHVPVPVVAYDPAMMEWMDMAVHNVFRLVDGVRTVADLVFSVAMGTTTTLAEVCAEALQRSAMERQAAQMMAPTTSLPGSSACTAQRSATASGDRVRSAAGGPSQPIVVSVPIDTRLCPSLLPGVRYSIQTSAAAVTISDGQVPLPSHVNVRVTPGAASGPGTLGASASVSSGTSDSAAAAPIASEEPGSNSVATTAAASSSQSLHIAVELPQTWVATTGIVMEALLHLELCHLIKVYLPWTEETLYSITNSAQRALCSACHPVRHVLAHYLLRVAWAERQERRKEQHRVIVERNPVQKESIIAQREARLASTSLRIIPPALPEKQHASAPLGVVSPQQRSSATGAVASPPVPPSSTARATAPAVTSVSGVGSAVTAIAVRSPDRLIGSSAWSPAASPRMSSSVPCASGTSHIGLHQQRPHQPRSLAAAGYVGSPSVVNAPRADTVSINVGGGGATHTRGLDQYSADTYASSPVSTSFAPSSLRHELSVGASGRLQLTLMNSLSTFSPRRSDFGGGAARSGTSPRLFLGNQGNQTSSGLLPCSATGVSQQQRQQQRWKQYPHKQACLGAAASFHSCSSTSKDSCASGSCRSSSSASPSVCNDGDSSSVSSSSSFSSSCATSMPISVSNMQQLVALSVAGVSAAPTSAVLEGIEVPVLSSLTAPAAESSVLAQASKDAIIVDTVVDPVQHPLDPPSDYGAGIELPTAELTAASALRTAERHAKRTSTAEALQRENRRRHSPSVKVFAPTEADVSHAAAAALCALAKFNNASVLSVQKEMRRMPVWATSFNHWSDRCVKALVEVALLNNWLEDVSR